MQQVNSPVPFDCAGHIITPDSVQDVLPLQLQAWKDL